MASDKYLILHMQALNGKDHRAGLDHILDILRGAVKEAVLLGRTLVINKFVMSKIHNRGCALAPFRIQKYINLDKTQIYKLEENGNLRSANNSFRYIDAENFNLDIQPKQQVLVLSGNDPVSDKQNDDYKVIIRYTTSRGYRAVYPNISVYFYPSDEVNRLTDIVLNAMGTSLDKVKQRLALLSDNSFSVDQTGLLAIHRRSPHYYTCMHLRIMSWDCFPAFPFSKYIYSQRNLKKVVDTAVLKKSVIYVMSDIADIHYFDFLKKDYIVYRYFHFPELRDLVSGDHKLPDNAMLYSVEKNILLYANVKIVREDLSRPGALFYTNYRKQKLPLWTLFASIYGTLRRRHMRRSLSQAVNNIGKLWNFYRYYLY